MRRYHIVFGILLILSIIDFALAVPVLVQEKRQAGVDVVHIPKDVTTALGKRVGEELAKVTEELLKSGEKPEASAGAHASSSSAPPEPEHGSTNVAQAPESNLAPSTTNSGPLMEPPSSAPESTTSAKHNELNKEGPAAPKTIRIHDHTLLEYLLSLSPKQAAKYGTKDWSSTSLGDPLPKVEPPKEVPQSSKLTDESDAKYWMSKYWTNMGEPPKGVGQAHESQHGQQPNVGPGPSDTGPSNAGPSNSPPTTTPDFTLGMKRPLSPPTDSERATMGYRPPPPPTGPDLNELPSTLGSPADPKN